MPEGAMPQKRVLVLFDTNPIWTGSMTDLVSRSTTELVRRYGGDGDLALRWCVPTMVIAERRYRMAEAAVGLLPKLKSMEKVLGESLGVDEGRVRSGINKHIADQCGALHFELVEPDVSRMDWNRIAEDAVHRRPPFEQSGDDEKEKGFRDAVIGETMLQCIEQACVSGSVDEVLVVTQDALLAEMLKSRFPPSSQARIVDGLDALRGQFEEIREGIDRDLTSRLRDRARQFFYAVDSQEPVNARGFAVDSGVLDETFASVVEKTRSLPRGGERKQVEQVLLGRPQFVKRAGNRMVWSSELVVTHSVWKRQMDYGRIARRLAEIQRTSPYMTASASGVTGSVLGLDVLQGAAGATTGTEPEVAVEQPEIRIATGTTRGFVQWSVEFDSQEVLSDGKVEGVEMRDVEWTEES
jgi:hypothetical protein